MICFIHYLQLVQRDWLLILFVFLSRNLFFPLSYITAVLTPFTWQKLNAKKKMLVSPPNNLFSHVSWERLAFNSCAIFAVSWSTFLFSPHFSRAWNRLLWTSSTVLTILIFQLSKACLRFFSLNAIIDLKQVTIIYWVTCSTRVIAISSSSPLLLRSWKTQTWKSKPLKCPRRSMNTEDEKKNEKDKQKTWKVKLKNPYY